jgi:hypothetical protein
MADKIFGLIKKTASYGIENLYLLYIFPPELHTLMTSLFLNSLTHPRKIILLVLQIGKVKDLSSAPLRILDNGPSAGSDIESPILQIKDTIVCCLPTSKDVK